MDEPPPIPSSLQGECNEPPPVPASAAEPPSIPTSPQAVSRKANPWLWVLGILGLMMLLTLGGIAALGYWGYHKFWKSESHSSVEQTIAVEMVKQLVSLQPGLEVVSTDKATGKLTIRDKESGETLALNLKDLQEGNFSFPKQTSANTSSVAQPEDMVPLENEPPFPENQKNPENEETAPSKETDIPGGDVRKAAQYRKAAEQGNAAAQYNLGVFYFTGRDLEKNYAEAAAWYRKSADQGNAHAQYNLGQMYHHGYPEMSKDYGQAAIWYRKAAEQGHAKAQRNLGRMYAHGSGVQRDEAEAFKWLTLAASQGQLDGKLIEELAAQMTPEKLEEAQKKLGEIQSLLEKIDIGSEPSE